MRKRSILSCSKCPNSSTEDGKFDGVGERHEEIQQKVKDGAHHQSLNRRYDSRNDQQIEGIICILQIVNGSIQSIEKWLFLTTATSSSNLAWPLLWIFWVLQS